MFINVTCSYVPVEIIHAAGFIPRRLIPPAPKEAGLLPRNYCSYARSCVLADDAAPVIFTTCCDGLRRCYDVRRAKGDRVFILDLPRQAKENNIKNYQQELLRMAQWLKEISAYPAQNGTLSESIKIYQGIRSELKKLVGSTWINRKFYEMLMAALTDAPENVLQRLKAFKANSSLDSAKQKIRSVLLTGTIFPDPGILDLLEENSTFVAFADFCLGERFYLDLNCSSFEEPWLALARAYLSKSPCPRMAGKSVRAFYIQSVLDRLRPKGVIFYGLKFCDHGLYEVPLWRSICSERGILFLHLESEYLSGLPAQLLTRIQAFLETV